MEDMDGFVLLENTWRESLTPDRLVKAEQAEALGFVGSLSISWNEPRTVQFAWNVPDVAHFESQLYDFTKDPATWLEAFDQATRRALGDDQGI